MSVGSVIKRVVSGAGHVARGVGQEVAGAMQPQPAPQSSVEAAPPADIGYNIPEFKLPALDPNDPDYEEKKAIHDAWDQLGQMHSDFAKTQNETYRKSVEDLAGHVRGRAAGKRFSPLSAFMIGMGNPEALKQVAATNAEAEQGDRQKEMDLFNLREQALKGQIAQMMEQGKFAQALKQSALLADVHATQGRIQGQQAHKAKLAEIKATQDAMTERTRMTNQRMIEVADKRLATVNGVIGKLPDADKQKMKSQLDAARAEFTKGISMNPVTGIEPTEEEKAAAWEKYQQKTNDIYDDAVEAVGKVKPVSAPAPENPAAAPSGANSASEGLRMKNPKTGKVGLVPPDKIARAKALGFIEVK